VCKELCNLRNKMSETLVYGFDVVVSVTVSARVTKPCKCRYLER